MKKYLNYAIIAISGLLVGRYILQPKQRVEIKEVVKYVENKQESQNKKTTTVKKETINSDGSSVTETVTTEDSSSSSKSEVALSKETSKKLSSRSISFGVLAVSDISSFRKKQDVGVLLVVPIIGNLSVAATADTSNRVGVGLSVEF